MEEDGPTLSGGASDVITSTASAVNAATSNLVATATSLVHIHSNDPNNYVSVWTVEAATAADVHNNNCNHYYYDSSTKLP